MVCNKGVRIGSATTPANRFIGVAPLERLTRRIHPSQRSMAAFARVVERLEADGFTVMYEGRGNWEQLEEWPWHMDALVYAARETRMNHS